MNAGPLWLYLVILGINQPLDLPVARTVAVVGAIDPTEENGHNRNLEPSAGWLTRMEDCTRRRSQGRVFQPA